MPDTFRSRPGLAVLAAGLGLAAPAHAEGLTGLLRSVTSAVAPAQKPQTQQSTSTMGVRGMDDGEQATGGPASEDYLMMEGWAVDAKAAANAAKKRELAARTVTMKKSSSQEGK
jgi:hypothetical protein